MCSGFLSTHNWFKTNLLQLWPDRAVAQILQYPTMQHYVAEMCTYMCARFCFKMVHCGIFHWCIVRYVRWVYFGSYKHSCKYTSQGNMIIYSKRYFDTIILFWYVVGVVRKQPRKGLVCAGKTALAFQHGCIFFRWWTTNLRQILQPEILPEMHIAIH